MRVSLEGAPCWPDFVFGENYKLTDILDLENFVKTNKHLPNIPKSKELVENGLEIGAMQALMMQKIEELTLYIIQLKKENELIKKLINKE